VDSDLIYWQTQEYNISALPIYLDTRLLGTPLSAPNPQPLKKGSPFWWMCTQPNLFSTLSNLENSCPWACCESQGWHI